MSEVHDGVSQEILRVIPPDAHSILEIGCGAGAMGEQFLRINPRAQYVGVELDAAAAAIAATRLQRVIVGDIETLDLASLLLEPRSIDVLVFRESLEQTVDPWGTLERLAGWLHPDGQVLVMARNIQHYSIVLDLMRGRWSYTEQGHLDKKQLRFFAIEEWLGLFSKAGLSIFDIQPIFQFSQDKLDGEHCEFMQCMKPAIEKLGLNHEAFSLRTRADRYLIRSIPTAAPPRWKLSIQTLISEPIVCARVRVREPDLFLGTIPNVRTLATTEPKILGAPAAGESPVFIRQRNLIVDQRMLTEQAHLIRYGFLIISEFDDDPSHFPSIAEHNYHTFSSCHAVQTSTEKLANILRPHNPNVRVFRNQIAQLPKPRATRTGEPFTIFFGAMNRENDWADIIEPLNRILKERSQPIRVRVVNDRAFYDAITTEFKDFEAFCHYERYIEILRSADVALLPLRDTRFNSCKSDLKFIECAAHRVVALASPTVYQETLDDRRTGLLFDSPTEFESKLNTLIDNFELRDALSERAYAYVAEHRLLSRHYRERYDWYLELLANKTELTRQIEIRVPAMFQR